MVLLLDSIEQIRGVGAEAKNRVRRVENLFSVHADNLRLDLLHVILPVRLSRSSGAGTGAYLGAETSRKSAQRACVSLGWFRGYAAWRF